ncbi:MAG: hypothetical protein JW841_12475 [Deltaproteobacteria bacterium]|nr:hypothetical protein [Deltaproteobacteria bacterium]
MVVRWDQKPPTNAGSGPVAIPTEQPPKESATVKPQITTPTPASTPAPQLPLATEKLAQDTPRPKYEPPPTTSIMAHAFSSSASALDKMTEKLRISLARTSAHSHERATMARAILVLCRSYAVRRSRGARKMALGLLDEIVDDDPNAETLATLLTAEGELHELGAEATASALARLVNMLENDETNAGVHASLCRSLTAHSLIQLVLHFPGTLEALEQDHESALTQAFALAEQAIIAAPEFADAHSVLGRVLLCSADPEAIAVAHQAFCRALTFDAEHDPAMAGIATIELNNGNAKQALVYADHIIKLGSGVPQAFHLRALVLSALNRYDDARRDIERALRQAPNAGLLHLDAARIALNLNDSRAAEIYEQNARILLGDDFENLKQMIFANGLTAKGSAI